MTDPYSEIKIYAPDMPNDSYDKVKEDLAEIEDARDQFKRGCDLIYDALERFDSVTEMEWYEAFCDGELVLEDVEKKMDKCIENKEKELPII